MAEPVKQRRKRRTKAEVNERICDSAKRLFAELGYAATTTREIAREADVSESLLFRYFGGKAALFEHVVGQPLNQLIQEVLSQAEAPDDQRHISDTHRLVNATFSLFLENEGMFRAIMDNSRDARSPESSSEFDKYFDASADQLRRIYAAKNVSSSLDLDIAARLGFGMIASGVLMRDWLFPEPQPSDEDISRALETMIERVFRPDVD